MKRLVVILLAVCLIIPTLANADEILVGEMDYDLENEISEDTDLLGYLLEKSNTTREEAHLTRESIDSMVKRSAGGMVSPHFVECWEDPYYLPRWTKRVTGSLRNYAGKSSGMFNFFLSSQIRTGYLTNWHMPYMPTMDTDPEEPLKVAIEEICDDEWLNTFEENANIIMTIGSKSFFVNDVQYTLDVAPTIIDGSTYIELRNFSEALSAIVEFNNETRIVSIKFKFADIMLSIEDGWVKINNKTIDMVYPLKIINNRTMLPLRIISEGLGYTVDFEASSKTITIKQGIGLPQKTRILENNLKAIEQMDNHKLNDLLARYILHLKRTCDYRNLALRKLPEDRLQDMLNIGRYNHLSSKDFDDEEFVEYLEETLPDDEVELAYDLAHDFDYNNIYYATSPLIVITDKLKSFLSDPRENSTEKDEEGNDIPGEPIDLSAYDLELQLPWGKFAFSGNDKDNTWDGDIYSSIIDLGGNDTYKGAVAGTAMANRPVSTCIDWSGNDKYISDKNTPCSQGFGLLGVGMLIDHEGDDEYIAYDNAQGGSYFGVGILLDEAGNDFFYGRQTVQAAGQFGVANLLNFGGDDTYYALGTSQGFGFCGGCGILADSEGNDMYIGETGHEGEGWCRLDREGEGWGLQTAATGGHDNDRNYSFVQGAGWGRRADLGDGHGLGGGTGILLDCKGDDFYECGVYGQATGYWFGTGILNDIEGNDSYRGSFFVQSGTAHMGLTELLDESGDDTYQVFKAISNGGAHDFSNSWFIDKLGDDRYNMYDVYNELDDGGNPTGETYRYAGGELCGGAITNSHAVHIDYDGDDYYELYTARSLGYCLQRTGPAGDSYRHYEWNVGLYINRGGEDTYKRVWDTENNVPEGWPTASNDACWKEVKQPGNLKLSIGFGLDIDRGIVPEAEW
jgi:hypothetical protein